MNKHNLQLARHAATDMSAVGWVKIANSYCLISSVWLTSVAEGDSVINATELSVVLLFTINGSDNSTVYIMLI